MLRLTHIKQRLSTLPALGWALLAVLVGLIAFAINYHIYHGNMPGYGWILAPGILFINCFTEEIDFWPKLGLLMTGQFLGYWLLVTLLKRLSRYTFRV